MGFFKGKVQSDWYWAITDTVQAANAGVDGEKGGSTDDSVGFLGLVKTFFNQNLKAAVTAGSVPVSRLNDMDQRRLRTLIRVRVMDSPAPLGVRSTRAPVIPLRITLPSRQWYC